MPLYQQQEGGAYFFILPTTSCIRCFSAHLSAWRHWLGSTWFPNAGSLWRWASSSTRTQSSKSLISFHCSDLLSGLKDDLFFWAVLFLFQLISKHHSGPGESLDALVWQPVNHGDPGCWLAPLIHGHALLSLLLFDCCSSVPHQLAVNLHIFCTLGSPNFKRFLKTATHSKILP